jgi:hypothetical protein
MHKLSVRALSTTILVLAAGQFAAAVACLVAMGLYLDRLPTWAVLVTGFTEGCAAADGLKDVCKALFRTAT